MDAGANAALYAAALWSGFLVILLVALSGLATRQRRRHGVVFGDQGSPEVARAVRTFGNAAEYVPAAMTAMALMALTGAPAALVHAVGGAFLTGRLAHAWSFSRNAGASIGRVVGMALTWLALLVAALSLVLLGLM